MEYLQEVERQDRLMDIVLKPVIKLQRLDAQQLFGCKEVKEKLDPSHIKEEQEELLVSQDGEQLPGPEEADIKSAIEPFPVKKENDDDKWSSQLYPTHTEKSASTGQMKAEGDGENCGVSEATSGCQQNFSDCSKSEPADTDYWQQKGRHRSAKRLLDLLHNIDEMESDGEEMKGVNGEIDVEVESVDGEEGEVLAIQSESDLGSQSDSDTEPVGEPLLQGAKDDTVWVRQTAGRTEARAPDCTLTHEPPGPTRYAKQNINSPLSSFMCLFDTAMWQQILECTTAEAVRNNCENFDLTDEELKAFVGLLYIRGITGGKRMKLEDYWSAELGITIFKDTMPRQRFRDIMRYLRFDDKHTRAERIAINKFALISEIFDKYVHNSIACYVPGKNITVDEQLLPTKARCRFSQYMANKAERFGIKLWVATDVDSKYMLNALPCLGRYHCRLAGQRFADTVMLRLAEPFLGKGRNITTNNFFTSLTLANNLLIHKTTLLGTMNTRRRLSTVVLKSGKATLTRFQTKPKKSLCILSTMDQGKRCETIGQYKRTKMGVDVMDQMARQYSVKGGTRRWPVAVFYSMLDLAAINAHVLYTQCLNKSVSRRKFIHELARELCANQRKARATAREAERMKWPWQVSHDPLANRKRKQCQVARCSGNKTVDICQTCMRYVCGKCSKRLPKICVDC